MNFEKTTGKVEAENSRGTARRAARVGLNLHPVSRNTQSLRETESLNYAIYASNQALLRFLFSAVWADDSNRLFMSSQNSGGSTAKDAVEQYLRNNSGWHEVRDLSNATGYDNDYIRRVAKDLASSNSNIQKRKNRNKPVIGYEIHGELKVPGGNMKALIGLIKTYGGSTPSNLQNKSISDLQKYIRNHIADSVVPLESKLEFRWR